MGLNLDVVAVGLAAFALALVIGVAVRLYWQRGKVIDLKDGANDNEASLAGKALRAHPRKPKQ